MTAVATTAALLRHFDELTRADVLFAGGKGANLGELTAAGLPVRVQAYEREVVVQELNAHGHRATETARALGLERSHLYKKCQQLGIDIKGERK